MQFSRIKTLLQHKVTLFLCFCCVTLASCEDPNELGLGLVDDNIAGNFTEVTNIDLSTVYVDSIVSSGSKTLLVGQYSTPNTGAISASALFQVGLSTSTWTLAEDATFDSLKLFLPYSGYNYGDTTKAATFAVQRLTGPIKARELSPYYFNERSLSYFYAANTLYNSSKTPAATENLATFTFNPRPKTKKDTLIVSLSNDLGREWFSLKKAADERLTASDKFLEYFPGLKLTSVSGSAVIGFPTASSKVRLYYSETVNGTKTKKRRDFAIINTELQYNRFQSNFDFSQLEGIVRGGAALPSAQSGNVSVAQGGSGLMVKVAIPDLANLKGQVQADLINRAVLIVEPLANTTQYPYPAPKSLALYTTNNANIPLTPLASHTDPRLAAEGGLTATYVEPTLQYPNGRYEFNLTPHLVELLKEGKTSGLTYLLAPSASDFTQGVSRLVVGGAANQQRSIRLKIYYTTIK